MGFSAKKSRVFRKKNLLSFKFHYETKNVTETRANYELLVQKSDTCGP
jgi:hypothetical protein